MPCESCLREELVPGSKDSHNTNVVAPSLCCGIINFRADVTESASVLGLRILWSLGMQDESHVHIRSSKQDDVMSW